MNMKKRPIWIFVSVLVLLVLLGLTLVGCSGTSQSQNETNSSTGESAGSSTNAAPIAVTMGTGPTTGGYYFIGAAMADVFSKYYSDYVISVEATSGTRENIGITNDGTVTVAMASAGEVADAVAGVNDYVDKQASNLRVIMAGHNNYVQWVTLANSGIKTYEDLYGKKVGHTVGAPNSLRALNALYGWDYVNEKDLKVEYAPHADQAESLKDGFIVAFGFDASIPNSTVSDLATTNEIRLLSYTPEMYDKVHAALPFFNYSVVPAGTYNGVNEDTPTLAIPALIITNEEAPEQFVYELTKLLLENTDEIAKAVPSAAEYKKETALSAFDLSLLHPGARRYYEEVGMLK